MRTVHSQPSSSLLTKTLLISHGVDLVNPSLVNSFAKRANVSSGRSKRNIAVTGLRLADELLIKQNSHFLC